MFDEPQSVYEGCCIDGCPSHLIALLHQPTTFCCVHQWAQAGPVPLLLRSP